MLRIRDVHPGFEFFPYRIPDRHQRFKYFNQKKMFLSSRKYYPGCSSRILIFYPSQIPDPGVKKAPDPGSATLIKRGGSTYRLWSGSGCCLSCQSCSRCCWSWSCCCWSCSASSSSWQPPCPWRRGAPSSSRPRYCCCCCYCCRGWNSWSAFFWSRFRFSVHEFCLFFAKFFREVFYLENYFSNIF